MDAGVAQIVQELISSIHDRSAPKKCHCNTGRPKDGSGSDGSVRRDKKQTFESLAS